MKSAYTSTRRIREAQLLVSSPERVFDELKARGEQQNWHENYDEELERSLLNRQDPLIDLGLAQYGATPEVVVALYRKALPISDDASLARYRKGLRIACLSNQNLARAGGWRARLDAFLTNEELFRILGGADSDEAEAFITNPEIDADILEALYACKEPFSYFPSDRWCDLVKLSSKNARILTNRTLVDYDRNSGYFYIPDIEGMRIRAAILNLLETAPTTVQWLFTLQDLLWAISPDQITPPEKIDHVLERWRKVEDTSSIEGIIPSLSLAEEFRCLIAALYASARTDTGDLTFGDALAQDVAVRCAYYGNERLMADNIREYYSRDGDVLVFADLSNRHIYSSNTLKNIIEYDYLCENLVGRYQAVCTKLQK